jgi:hypothetical protein
LDNRIFAARYGGVYVCGEGTAGDDAKGGAADGSLVSGVAHCPQKANPGGLAKPHVGHGPVRGEAHCPQNFIPTGLSNPQLGQRIGPLRGGDHAAETGIIGVIDDACGTVRQSSFISTPEPPTSQAKSRRLPEIPISGQSALCLNGRRSCGIDAPPPPLRADWGGLPSFPSPSPSPWQGEGLDHRLTTRRQAAPCGADSSIGISAGGFDENAFYTRPLHPDSAPPTIALSVPLDANHRRDRVNC